MRWHFGLGLRSRLLLLVVLSALPAFGLVIYNGIEQRRLAEDGTRQDALRILRFAATTHERSVSETRQILVFMSRLWQVQNTEYEKCNTAFAELLQENRELYLNLGLTDTNGVVRASAIPSEISMDAGNRLWFCRALKKQRFSSGDYQIDPMMRRPSLCFGIPVKRGNMILGVAYASLDLAWLNRLVARQNLPAGAVMFGIDHHGRVLARYPSEAGQIGEIYTNAPIVQTILRMKTDGSAESTGLDEGKRLFVFQSLSAGGEEGGRLFIALGVPTSIAYADAQRALWRSLRLLGLTVMLLLLLAWWGSEHFVLRQIRAVLDATRRFAAGDVQSRSGIPYTAGEVGQMAEAFDEMAERLTERTAERERTSEALRLLNEDLERRVSERTAELQDRNEHLRADISLARDVQMAFLPQKYPAFPRNVTPQNSALRFSHRYQPTTAVGGDFFDVLALSDSKAGIFICDVMGQGMRAALVTAIIRGLVEELKPHGHDPSLFLTEVNRGLLATLGNTGLPMFASAFYMVVDVASGELKFASAGHPRPIHRRLLAGVSFLQPTEFAPGPVLGMFEDTLYRAGTQKVDAGDFIVLYTDGVYEVEGTDSSMYGEERLAEGVRQRLHIPTDQIFDELLREIRTFSIRKEFSDDVCLVGVEVVRIGPDWQGTVGVRP